MAHVPAARKRVAVFSRYPLGDQYDLAAEFKGMLQHLGSDADVLHLSLRGRRPPPSPPLGVTVDELPVTIDRKNPRDMLLKTFLMYLLLPVAALRLRRYRPHAIFISEILPLAGLFFRVACRTRVATAYGDWHVHNFLGRKAWSRPLLRVCEWLERFEARHLDGFFCRAAAAREKLAAWGVPRESVCVVRDAPDPAAFFPQDQAELRHACGFAADDVVLLYHGVMHQGKGLDQLLTWTAALQRENPGIGIILVGAGPELQPLKDLAARLGLGARAHFTGWLKTVQEVGAYCNAADLCVAMRTGAESNVHIVPGALLHSMACRKVVIGPRLPGVAEILRDGDNGFLFAPDDGEDFKRLIRRLIEARATWPDVARRAYEDIQEHYAVPAAARLYADALMHYAGDRSGAA